MLFIFDTFFNINSIIIYFLCSKSPAGSLPTSFFLSILPLFFVNSKQSSILERLGERHRLSSIVDLSYEKVLEDDHLIEFFAGYDIDDLIDHQKRFISFAFTEFPEEFDVFWLDHQTPCTILWKRMSWKALYGRMIYHLVQSLQECRISMGIIRDVVAVVKPYRKAFEDGAKRYKADCKSLEQSTDRYRISTTWWLVLLKDFFCIRGKDFRKTRKKDMWGQWNGHFKLQG